MEGILKPNGPGDIRHATVLIPEEMGGTMQASLENILHGGHAKVVAKQFGEVLPREPRLLCHTRHGKHGGRVAIHPEPRVAKVFWRKIGLGTVQGKAGEAAKARVDHGLCNLWRGVCPFRHFPM